MPDNKVTELWVCAGQRQGRGGKMFTQWFSLDAAELGEPLNFSAMAGCRVGQVYEVHAARDGEKVSIVTAGAEQPAWVREYEDKDLVLEWTLNEESAKSAKAIESLNKKVKDREALVAQLEPITRHYGKTKLFYNRNALLASVINIITMGELPR
jgi:hypothetical protein